MGTDCCVITHVSSVWPDCDKHKSKEDCDKDRHIAFHNADDDLFDELDNSTGLFEAGGCQVSRSIPMHLIPNITGICLSPRDEIVDTKKIKEMFERVVATLNLFEERKDVGEEKKKEVKEQCKKCDIYHDMYCKISFFEDDSQRPECTCKHIERNKSMSIMCDDCKKEKHNKCYNKEKCKHCIYCNPKDVFERHSIEEFRFLYDFLAICIKHNLMLHCS